MPITRWHRCPGCGSVMRGGELKPVRFGAHWNAHGLDKRRCPRCGKVASTRDFRLVRQAMSQ